MMQQPQKVHDQVTARVMAAAARCLGAFSMLAKIQDFLYLVMSYRI